MEHTIKKNKKIAVTENNFNITLLTLLISQNGSSLPWQELDHRELP
jgi:hypothetical protein